MDSVKVTSGGRGGAKRGMSMLVVAAGGILLAGMGGCNNAVEGGLSGAGLGALGGMAIGSTMGKMGKRAAIGAVIGGVGGAIIGDQNQRADSRNSRYRDEME